MLEEVPFIYFILLTWRWRFEVDEFPQHKYIKNDQLIHSNLFLEKFDIEISILLIAICSCHGLAWR